MCGRERSISACLPSARIKRDDYSFSGSIYGETALTHYPLIPLTDGGVYDNCGLEALIKPVRLPGLPHAIEMADFLIVSDGGAPARFRFDRLAFLPSAKPPCCIEWTRSHANKRQLFVADP